MSLVELRELDECVAEKVFGALRPADGKRIAHHDPATKFWGTHVVAGDVAQKPIVHFHGPAYSTDIAAAWEVVKHLAPDYYVEVCEGGADRPNVAYCRVYHNSALRCITTADTAPLAICYAALKAVGA